MSKELVKLPKLVAEGINNARELKFSNQEIILKSLESADHSQWRDAIRDYAADNFDLFIQALVNGHEIEETPEDKVRNYYNISEGVNPCAIDARRYAIKGTLNLLNIKIDGVNA